MLFLWHFPTENFGDFFCIDVTARHNTDHSATSCLTIDLRLNLVYIRKGRYAQQPEGIAMNIEVRKVTLDDSDQVFSLVESFAVSFKPEKKAFHSSLRQLHCDDSVLIKVAVLKNDVVAYCLVFDHYALYANGRVAWLEEIMVREDLRGKGIGTALMKCVENWAVSRNAKLIGLATRRAAPFYMAMGYEKSATFFRKILES